MTSKYNHIILLFLLIACYLANGISSIQRLSITADEGSHLAFGIKMLKGDPARTNPEKDNSKMPISVLNALPRAIEQYFQPNLSRDDNGVMDTVHGRYITLFFSVLIILLVFQWSRSLYGTHAGLFSAFLYCCCPNSIANAVLVTTETYSAFFLLATMYFFWRSVDTGRSRDLVWFALSLAGAQLAKQSLFHLYVLVPVCMLLLLLVQKQRLRLGRSMGRVLFVALVSLLLINAGFIFWHVGKPLGEYHFMSNLFQRVQQVLPAGLPMPFSESFITGLDQAKYYDQLGGGFVQSSFANVTILDKSSTGGSFWYYYFVSLFFKTPISYLLIFACAGWLLFRKQRLQQFMQREFFLLAPVLYYLVVFSFLYKTQCGIRHIVFLYPLLFVCSGIVYQYAASRISRWLLVVAGIWLLASVGSYFNNYYAYTNEFITDKKEAYRFVGASNLNFNQSDYFLRDYLRTHPDVQSAPAYPKTGRFVLSVDQYLDIWNTGKYQWLRKKKPIGHIAHSYLLFVITDSDLQP